MALPPDTVPEQPSEQHFLIPQKGAERLGKLVDGNGLKAEQVRLSRHETLVHQLPGEVNIVLKPDMIKNQLKGNRAHGQVCGTEAEVMSKADGFAQQFVADKDVHVELLQLLDKDPGRGWGIEPFKHPLLVTRKQFCVVDNCLKCSGQGRFSCTSCNGGGAMMCGGCNGQGVGACPNCGGQGGINTADGGRAPCGRCASTGRTPCMTCQGAKQLRCTACGGGGKLTCSECDGSGCWTHIYDMTFHAEAEFILDREQVPQDVLAVVDRLGIRQLATEGHAEIFRLPESPEQGHLIVPYLAFLPLCNAEFSIEGRQYPSGVAGLTGRIMGIDPVLDPVMKPGINALFKLSKGPLAVEALIDQACKYRLLRQVISGLSHHSKKQVYFTLAKEYPLVVSEKYLKGAIKYADIALLALGKGPRIKGLLLGTAAAAGIYALYYMGPVRAIIMAQLVEMQGRHMEILPDLAVYLGGYLVAWLAVKYMAAGALKKLLPSEVQTASDKGLPSAGEQGWHALLTTLLAWVAFAFVAAGTKPMWVLMVLKMLGRTP